MSGPRILLIVGGGIAAYKSCELVRLIRKGGGDVTCVLTAGGAQFVTPMALASLSGNQVHTSLWDLKNEAEIGHIQLSREADLVVVCPATADLMARMAAGIADDLATTLLLATDKAVLAVPAMNVRMWQHAATQRNMEWLSAAGVRVMQPDEGEMACGEFGPGRLPEPEMVWLEIADLLGLEPGEAGERDIEEYLEALEPDEEPEPESRGWASGRGLGGLLSSIIPRSTARRIADDEVAYGELQQEYLEPIPPEVPLPHELSPNDYHGAEEGGDAPVEEAGNWPDLPGDGAEFAGPPLPEPDLDAGGPLLAKKGWAAAAPPTDREAINHQVNPVQSAPQPFADEPHAAPAGMGLPLVTEEEDPFDPLQGIPIFAGSAAEGPLAGRHVLVTAGPTHEPIDPVRYLGNRSSGRQGFAIAAAAAAAGARVTLVAGPVHLKTPLGVDRIDIESADNMAAAVKAALPADCAIMVAAVADWRTRDYVPEKIKKRGSAPPALMLTENPDILATIGASPARPPLLVGFAAETGNVIENAQKKRKAKGADWIVANDVSGDVMGGLDNQVHIVREGKVESWDSMSKQEVAFRLVENIAAALAEMSKEHDQ